MPKISVIIVNWNGKHFLEVCLSSLRDQIFRDFETILVDNGSQDGSVKFVQEHFPEVRLVPLQYNSGFAAGNVAGYEQALGELIVLLNNDTRADPAWLLAINKAAGQLPNVGSFASKMLYFDEPEKIENCGFDLSLSGATVDLGRDELDGEAWSHSRQVFGACGGAATYRRSMLQEIGFLDPEFFLIYEDVDLAFRAQLRGFSCVYLPDAIVYHRYRASIGMITPIQVFYSQRNIELFFFKNMPFSLLLRAIPQRVVYEIGAAIYFLKLGSGSDFLRAKTQAIRLLPSVWGQRRDILKMRKISTGQLRRLFAKTSLSSKCRKLFSLWKTSAGSQIGNIRN